MSNCHKCQKLILEPNVTYGINQDMACMCGITKLNYMSESIQDQKADEIDELLENYAIRVGATMWRDDMAKAKQAILALKERWTREARIDELDKVNYKYFLRGSSWVEYFNNRIAQLGGKE